MLRSGRILPSALILLLSLVTSSTWVAAQPAVGTAQERRLPADLQERLPAALEQEAVADLRAVFPDTGTGELVLGSFLYRFRNQVVVDSQLVAPLGLNQQHVVVMHTAGRTQAADSATTEAVRRGAGQSPEIRVYELPLRAHLRVESSLLSGFEDAVLTPVFWAVPERLQFEAESQRFTTTLRLALADPNSPAQRDLAAPFPLFLSSEADVIEPDSVLLTGVNRPSVPVRIVARAPADSVHGAVRAYSLKEVAFWIPVRPVLSLSAPSKMQGWGIEEATVTVRLVGRTLGVESTLPVTLSLDAGGIDEAMVHLGSAGAASTKIRSAGTGQARLAASGPGVQPGSTPIEYILPYYFALAAVLGGLFGGLVQALRSGRSVVKGILFGLAFGPFAAIAYFVLGVKVFELSVDVPHFNDAAVFALAMLGAFALYGQVEAKVSRSAAED